MTKQKATTDTLPVRNTVYEALIHVGAVGMLTYAFGLLLITYVTNAFHGTSSSVIGTMSFLLVVLCVVLVMQATALIRQRQRVDRYPQRFIATILTCLLPLLFIIRLVASNLVSIQLRAGGDLEAMYNSWFFVVINFLNSAQFLSAAVMASAVGAIWLGILLRKKDRLFWVLEGNSRTKAYKTRQLKLARNNQIGSWLVAAPAILLVIYIVAALSAGAYGNDATLRLISDTAKTILTFGWIPSVVAGVIVLIRNT